MDEPCDLLEVGDHSLRETFIVTDFVEKVVTADNDNLPT